MAAGIWTAQIQSWMDEIDALSLYGGLFSATPFGTDPLTVEVVGGGYNRVAFTHDRAAYNMIRNHAQIVWLNLPAGVHIWGVGAWDAAVNGNLKAVCPLATAVDLATGGTWALNAGELQFGIDVVLGP